MAVSIVLPGRADRVIADGGFRHDHPEIFARYQNEGRLFRRGRGYNWAIELDVEQWAALAQYLASKEGALAAAIAEVGDRSDRADHKAVGQALDRIEVGARLRVRRYR